MGCFVVGYFCASQKPSPEIDSTALLHGDLNESILTKPLGCWTGKEGGLFKFTNDQIVVNSKIFTILPINLNYPHYEGQYLFKVISTGPDTKPLDNILSVKLNGIRKLELLSYKSYEDLARSTSVGESIQMDRSECYDLSDKSPHRIKPITPNEKFLGHWSGDAGSELKIDRDEINFRGDKLTYEFLDHTLDSFGEKYLLLARGRLKDYSSLSRILVIRFDKNNEEMYWIRFESIQDFAENRYTGLGQFYRVTESK